MSKTTRPRYTQFVYSLLVVGLFGLTIVGFSIYSKAKEQPFQPDQPAAIAITSNVSNTVKQTESCGLESLDAGAASTLAGTYYSLKSRHKSILMFNNKGPQPLVVNPTVFSMSGERLNLAPLTIGGVSYQEFDLSTLLANAGQQFSEGSIQVTHQGMKQQLGVQVKILKSNEKLIFDEQFVEPTKRFISSRLENVWWLPSQQAETKFIVSNTTDSPVTATITVNGTVPRQRQPVSVQLNPHQTRALDILGDLVGQPGGTINREGGISITHSGAAGAILARMFVFEESSGFSSASGFADPQTTRSSKWNGSGFRIGQFANEQLTPVIVARNIGTEPTHVSGRLTYTNDAGEVAFVNVQAQQLAANEARSIDVASAISQSNVPASVTHTGFEFQYSTSPGTVIMTALSASQSRNHVFQVPLADPGRAGTSAGGYPWKADGDYSTILYIKNETGQPQKYTASLIFEGGDYTLGVKDIKPHQLVAIDFRALRNSQTPDVNGNTIPLLIQRGQMAWSSKSRTKGVLSGRSHQSSESEAVSSTYDCRNHCSNTFYDGWIIYDYYLEYIDDVSNFTAYQQDINSYGTTQPAYPVTATWQVTDPAVLSVDSYGTTTATDFGTAYLQASWPAYRLNGEVASDECAYVDVVVFREEPVEVRPRVEILRNGQVIAGTGRATVTQNVVAGEKISLTTRVTRGTGTSQWTIDSNKAIKDYVVIYSGGQARSARKLDLESSDLDQSNVDFYWIVGGNSLEARYTITIRGARHTATAVFNVKKPTSILTTRTGEVGLGFVENPPKEDVFALHYGRVYDSPGIRMDAGVTLPSGVSGQTAWAQVVNTRRTRTPVGGTQQVLQGIGLDGEFPDLPGELANEDSPLEPIDPCLYTAVSVTDNFATWLMFKPQVSNVTTIYVPLKKVEWSWSGTATRVAACYPWALTNSSRTRNPSGVDTIEYPEWFAHVRDFPWQ